ncbi:44573_t:CDS:1, partial [Gigaspora margarita]
SREEEEDLNIEEIINEEWEVIEKAILKAASKHIPSKIIKYRPEEVTKHVDRSPLFWNIKNLERLTR